MSGRYSIQIHLKLFELTVFVIFLITVFVISSWKNTFRRQTYIGCSSSMLEIKKLHLRKVKLFTFLEEKVWIVKKIRRFMGIINEIYTSFYYGEGYKLYHQKFDERRSYFKKFLIRFMR